MAINAETITAIASAVGLSGIVAAAINTISNRKKTGADATKVITDAALGVVARLEGQITTLLQQVSDLERRENLRDRREAAAQRELMRHHQWDLTIHSVVQQYLPDHVHLFPPPPLFADEDSKVGPETEKEST